MFFPKFAKTAFFVFQETTLFEAYKNVLFFRFKNTFRGGSKFSHAVYPNIFHSILPAPNFSSPAGTDTAVPGRFLRSRCWAGPSNCYCALRQRGQRPTRGFRGGNIDKTTNTDHTTKRSLCQPEIAYAFKSPPIRIEIVLATSISALFSCCIVLAADSRWPHNQSTPWQSSLEGVKLT